MSMVSISEAARLVGISRTNFYKNYLKRGKISLSRNAKDQPVIDTAELLRVFGNLQRSSYPIAKDNTAKTQENPSREGLLLERLQGLEQLLKAREAELEGYREREKHQQEREKTFCRLLEDKATKKRPWWPFGRR